jgi:predicted DNA-binding antitoxin AbrB/MazE fold protein
MPKKRKKLRGEIKKVIRQPGEAERAQVEVPQADELYRELRIINEASDSESDAKEPQRFREGEKVNVTIETDSDPNTRKAR